MPAAIQSIGLPPELHADRVVAEMLRVILDAHAERQARMRCIFGRMPDANPKAQAKLAAALDAAGGSYVVKTRLKAGKRGRYSIDIYTIDGWDPAKHALLDVDDPIPPKPWLACTHVTVISHGNGTHRYDEDVKVHLLISHHALSRLCQRCGARTQRDLWHAACEIWRAFLDEMVEHPNTKWPKDGYRLRFQLSRDRAATTGLAILSRYDDERGGVVVATILDDPLARCVLAKEPAQGGVSPSG